MASITVNFRRVVLPTGTTFGISLANGQELPMQVVDDNYVAALFPQDDVAFRINVDNSRSERGITFEITINGQSHWYNIDAGVKGEPMQALVANGRKLHFKNQATDDGKTLVAATAAKYGMRYKDAAIMCCQINVSVKVEKLPERIVPVRIVQPHCCTSSMYYSAPQGCTTFDGIQRPGAPTDNHVAEDFHDSVDCLPMASPQSVRSTPSRYGERGVICYGQESNQTFGASKSAEIDYTYIIKPFVIELRMEPNYAPI